MSSQPNITTTHVKAIRDANPTFDVTKIYDALLQNYRPYYAGKDRNSVINDINTALVFLQANPTWQPSTVARPFIPIRPPVPSYMPPISIFSPVQPRPSLITSEEDVDLSSGPPFPSVRYVQSRARSPPTTSTSLIPDLRGQNIYQASSSNSVPESSNGIISEVIYTKEELKLEGNTSPTPVEILNRINERSIVPYNLFHVESTLQKLRDYPSMDRISDTDMANLKRKARERWAVKQAIRYFRQQNIEPNVEDIKARLRGTGIWSSWLADPTLDYSIKRIMEFLQKHPDYVYTEGTTQTVLPFQRETLTNQSELNNFRWQVKKAKSMLEIGHVMVTPANIERYLRDNLKLKRDLVQRFSSVDFQQKIREALRYIRYHPHFNYEHETLIDPVSIIKSGDTIRVQGVELEQLGINRNLPEIMKFVNTAIKYSEQFERLGTMPSKAAIFILPDGFNVDLIMKSLAENQRMKLFSLNAINYLSQADNFKDALDNVFTEAVDGEPAIIYLKNLDRMFEALSTPHSQILSIKRTLEIQNFLPKVQVLDRKIVLIATVQSNAGLGDLNRAEYFSTQIRIALPDNEARQAMFVGMSQRKNISEDVLEPKALQEIISHTPGYTQADLELLFNTAANFAIEREHTKIELADIRKAVLEIKPLSVQSGLSKIPDVSWDDLGGLFQAKNEIFSTIMFPLKYPEVYKKFGIKQSSGVILYGPPGTGKTMIAKAIANDATANFISVKPSDVLQKYLGVSEDNVKKFFAQAAALAPCVLFFDEFESIGGVRSGDSEVSSKARNSIITQLLIEMDGVQSRDGVYLLAATNRLDAVDPAFLRPGRFDKRVYVGLPTEDERENILDVAINSLKSNGIEIEPIDTRTIAQQTDGFSAAELDALVHEAASIAAHEFINTMVDFQEPFTPRITSADFSRAVQNYARLTRK